MSFEFLTMSDLSNCLSLISTTWVFEFSFQITTLPFGFGFLHFSLELLLIFVDKHLMLAEIFNWNVAASRSESTINNFLDFIIVIFSVVSMLSINDKAVLCLRSILQIQSAFFATSHFASAPPFLTCTTVFGLTGTASPTVIVLVFNN